MIGAPVSPLPSLCRLTALVATTALLALAGCGGAAAGEAAKSPEPQQRPQQTMDVSEPEPTSVEEAEKLIARAKADLGATGVATASPSVVPSSPTSPASPGGPTDYSSPPSASPAPASEPAPRTRPSMPESPPKAALSVEDRCASQCKALASMRRAVGALCRMTGTEDNRCVDAQRTLTDSEKRVSACSC